MISKISYLAKKTLMQLFGVLGLGITTKANLNKLKKMEISRSDSTLKLLTSFSPEVGSELLKCISESRSQLQQDLFVLGMLGCKRNGYFVEFGATDGISLSNTFLLESKFGWTGILAEPALKWRGELLKNRPLSEISDLCVWKTSGERINFRETEQTELSTLEAFRSSDAHRNDRSKGSVYEVETISLEDLLVSLNAPRTIDFLSIDTEGSEFDILESFNFEAYNFSVIVCEHNFTENRNKINHLLTSKGYVQVLEDVSFFDDWYVSMNLSSVIKRSKYKSE